MIVCIVGTSAETIKVQPILRRLADRGVPFEIWATYQHTDALDKVLASLGLPEPAYVFARGAKGHAIERPRQMVSWLFACFRSLFRDRKALRKRLGSKPLVIVHGDTVTTLFGAIAAKVLRSSLAHVEAGLRSGKLFSPFPEEIDRRVVGRLADFHFAPNDEAFETLRGRDVVNTHRNTAIDGVLDVLGTEEVDLESPYGLVLLHRYEFISQPDFVRETIATLEENSPVPLVLLTDAYSGGPVTDALREIGSVKIRAIGKLSYPKFVNAMAGAEFIFTDSGGTQEEAGLLGVPTMLHRQVTERPDGLGQNIVLSEWDLRKVVDFLNDFDELRRPLNTPAVSPSDIVFSELERRLFVGGPETTSLS